MKSIIPSIGLLAGLVAGQNLPAPDNGPWVAGAYNPTIPWAPATIHAADGAFWVGIDGPSTNCPADDSEVDCSQWATDQTVFMGGNNTVTMDVGFERGQKVYIAPDGTVAFTPAASACLPPGSQAIGFDRFRSQAWGGPIVLTHVAGYFLACPVEGMDADVYKVMAKVDDEMDITGCITFQWRTYGTGGDDSRAWSYE